MTTTMKTTMSNSKACGRWELPNVRVLVGQCLALPQVPCGGPKRACEFSRRGQEKGEERRFLIVEVKKFQPRPSQINNHHSSLVNPFTIYRVIDGHQRPQLGPPSSWEGEGHVEAFDVDRQMISCPKP